MEQKQHIGWLVTDLEGSRKDQEEGNVLTGHIHFRRILVVRHIREHCQKHAEHTSWDRVCTAKLSVFRYYKEVEKTLSMTIE